MRKRVLVVGGVAGGASYAARLRRLDETAPIAVFDRAPHVSFANCGLPYFVGNVIADEGELLLASRELFRQRFAIAVCTRHEAVAIDRARRVLRVRDLDAPGGPAQRRLAIYRGVGRRVCSAVRFPAQHGHRAANLSGGHATYASLRAAGLIHSR